MKTKSIKNIIAFCIVILVIFLSCFGIKYSLNKNLERQKQEEQDIINKYGVLEKESIENTIKKFNITIENMNNLIPLKDTYLTIDNSQYWYGLVDGLYCFVIPEKFTGNKNKDISKKINIYYEKETNNKEIAIQYLKLLIKSNNEEISEEELNKFITDAEKLAKENKLAYNGKGITLGIFESDQHIEYQVTRLY